MRRLLWLCLTLACHGSNSEPQPTYAMDLSRYNEQLKASIGEAATGGGSLIARVSWQDFDATGKFLGYGSAATFFNNVTQTVIAAWEGSDDGSVRKITGMQIYNADSTLPHLITIYVDKRGFGLIRAFQGNFAVNGSLIYHPSIGFKIYDANGQ